MFHYDPNSRPCKTPPPLLRGPHFDPCEPPRRVPSSSSNTRRRNRSDSIENAGPPRILLFEYTCSSSHSSSTLTRNRAMNGEFGSSRNERPSFQPPPTPLLPSLPIFVPTRPRRRTTQAPKSSPMLRSTAVTNFAFFTQQAFAEDSARADLGATLEDPVPVMIANEHEYASSDEMDIIMRSTHSNDPSPSWWSTESTIKAPRFKSPRPSESCFPNYASSDDESSSSSSHGEVFSSCSSSTLDAESIGTLKSPEFRHAELSGRTSAGTSPSSPNHGSSTAPGSGFVFAIGRDEMDGLRPRSKRSTNTRIGRRSWRIVEENEDSSRSLAKIGLGLGLSI